MVDQHQREQSEAINRAPNAKQSTVVFKCLHQHHESNLDST
ncbi:hypothetical protein SynA1840_01205 [Synechococcus sp. A18-40]|nr:hypothetical protein SynA1840_01205 [Synechococcus sp. A18-40]